MTIDDEEDPVNTEDSDCPDDETTCMDFEGIDVIDGRLRSAEELKPGISNLNDDIVEEDLETLLKSRGASPIPIPLAP